MFTTVFVLGIVSETAFTLDFAPWWSSHAFAVTVVVVVLAAYAYLTSARGGARLR